MVQIRLQCRDVNVFIFQKKRSFRYENDDEKSKTKRLFLETIVFFKVPGTNHILAPGQIF